MEAIMIIILLGVAAIICLRFYNTTIVPMKNKSAMNKTASLVSYDRVNLTATITKRASEITKVITIANDHNYTIAYEPVKLHIGAVSVGGVTTGGTYTTGGYNYVSSTTKSGYYQLQYAGQLISHIKLNDSDYQKAKQSPIAPFLDDKKHQIDVIESVQCSEQEARAMINNLKTTGYVGNEFLNDKRGYPSYEKCALILEWLSSPEKDDAFMRDYIEIQNLSKPDPKPQPPKEEVVAEQTKEQPKEESVTDTIKDILNASGKKDKFGNRGCMTLQEICDALKEYGIEMTSMQCRREVRNLVIQGEVVRTERGSGEVEFSIANFSWL